MTQEEIRELFCIPNIGGWEQVLTANGAGEEMAGQEQVGTQSEAWRRGRSLACPGSPETLVEAKCFFLVAPPSAVTLLH